MTVSGLQAERTSLAWSRTALALLADAGLLLRDPLPGRFVRALAVVALALAGLTGLVARCRARELASDPQSPDPHAGLRVLGLGCAVALLASGVGVAALLT